MKILFTFNLNLIFGCGEVDCKQLIQKTGLFSKQENDNIINIPIMSYLFFSSKLAKEAEKGQTFKVKFLRSEAKLQVFVSVYVSFLLVRTLLSWTLDKEPTQHFIF